ncbi:MAG: hypothetical protein ABII21_00520 [bacterium]
MIKNKQIFSIRETAEILVPDSLGRSSYVIGFGLIVLMMVFITLLYSKLPLIVPIYFTLPWGEARLATKLMLYTIPGIALVFLILNLGLGRVATKLSPLLPRVLAVSTAIIAAMMMVSLLGIVQSLVL